MKKSIPMLCCLLTICLMISSGRSLSAQEESKLELPETDIFLFEIQSDGDKITLGQIGNITDRPGYDNQPWFTPESKSILFTANGQPDRTDVFEYFIESRSTQQVTDTPNQEYSPQMSPDNKTLSFVTDGATANQSIWSADRDDISKESWLLAQQGEREPVGYYAWNHETGYILYWSRYGFNIRLVHEEQKLSHYIAGDTPPASPWIIPETTKFSFVHQQGNEQVWIKELDPETLAIRPLVAINGANRNYGWAPDQSIYMIQDDELFRWNGYPADRDAGWASIANLDEFGISGSSRVNVSPDGKMIAIVGVAK